MHCTAVHSCAGVDPWTGRSTPGLVDLTRHTIVHSCAQLCWGRISKKSFLRATSTMSMTRGNEHSFMHLFQISSNVRLGTLARDVWPISVGAVEAIPYYGVTARSLQRQHWRLLTGALTDRAATGSPGSARVGISALYKSSQISLCTVVYHIYCVYVPPDPYSLKTPSIAFKPLKMECLQYLLAYLRPKCGAIAHRAA